VAVVEDKFLNKREDDELEDDPVKRWQFAAEAASTPLHHNERRVHERNADDRLIDDHPDDSLSQLSTIHLRRHQHLLHPLTPHIMPRYTHKHPQTGQLGSRVVSVLDSGAEGPGFKSQPRRCRITVLGKLFTPILLLLFKQQNW